MFCGHWLSLGDRSHLIWELCESCHVHFLIVPVSNMYGCFNIFRLRWQLFNQFESSNSIWLWVNTLYPTCHWSHTPNARTTLCWDDDYYRCVGWVLTHPHSWDDPWNHWLATVGMIGVTHVVHHVTLATRGFRDPTEASLSRSEGAGSEKKLPSCRWHASQSQQRQLLLLGIADASW